MDIPVDRPTSTKTYRVIVDYLRKSIENGRYKQGEKLPSEKELSRLFDASRSSVREALVALEYIGMIEARSGSGYYVSGNKLALTDDLFKKSATKVIYTIDSRWNIKALKTLFECGIDGVCLLIQDNDSSQWSKQVRAVHYAAHNAGTYVAVLAEVEFDGMQPDLAAFISFAAHARIDGILVNSHKDINDILTIRRLLDEQDSKMLVLTKITGPIDHIDDILRITDGIIIDPVLVYAERGSAAFADYIAKCNLGGKIIFFGVRIEDTIRGRDPGYDAIVRAVTAGCDGIAVTTDGAAGKFPVDVFTSLKILAAEAEERLVQQYDRRTGRVVSSPLVNALCSAAVQAACALKAVAFIVPTETGFTPRLLTKFRQGLPILAISPNPAVIRQLRLVWGVHPLLSRRVIRNEDLLQVSLDTAMRSNNISEGDAIVGILASMDIPDADNSVKLIIAGDIILKGQGIGEGIVSGRTAVIKTMFDINKRVKDKIVVIKSTDIQHVKLIQDAAGLIVEEGGLSSHAAISCLSMGKPLIVGAADATSLLLDDEQITMDVMRGLVYKGWVNLG